ncbi:DUF5993 family protein [Pseudomonas chlororaphis]
MSAIALFLGKRRVGICLWLLLLVVSVAWFDYHSTDPLTLSF